MIYLSAWQSLKAASPIWLMLAGRTTSSRLSQFKNVLRLISVIPLGMVMRGNETQFAKAPSPMDCNPVGRAMFSIRQLKKA